jgi:hypothetical protein
LRHNLGGYGIVNKLMKDKRKKTTEGVTFRIPSNTLSELREESDKKRVSLNTLVNQIFKDHIDWHRYASQARSIDFPRSVISRVFDKLTQEELSEIAVDIAKKNFVDLALLRGEVTISFYLDTIENWLRVSALPYKHEVNDNVHNFIIEHRMGKNFSFFLKEYNSNILDMLEIKSDFNITDNIVAFKFNIPD